MYSVTYRSTDWSITHLNDVVNQNSSSMSVVGLFGSSSSQTSADLRHDVFALLTRLCAVNMPLVMSRHTTAQQLLRWATVWPQQTWPKSRGCCAPFRGGAGFPSNIMSPGLRPTYQVVSWFIQPFGHNRRPWPIKWGGGCCAPFRGGKLGPI